MAGERTSKTRSRSSTANLELGGNFIDTANFYTKSHSEKIIGDHIGRYREKRDRIVIATKFSGNLYPGDPNAGTPVLDIKPLMREFLPRQEVRQPMWSRKLMGQYWSTKE